MIKRIGQSILLMLLIVLPVTVSTTNEQRLLRQTVPFSIYSDTHCGRKIVLPCDRRKPLPGCLFHSDRGSQYAGDGFRAMLQRYGFRQSMSSTGNCYDNAIMETFFHTLKTELVYFERYETRSQAQTSIFEYIEVFYNRQRRHSSLNYKSPVDFERLAEVA